MSLYHLIPTFLFRRNTIRKSLFLTPQNWLWKHLRPNNLERSSNQKLLHSFLSRNQELRINFIIKIDKSLIQEGDSCFESKMWDVSVNSEPIIQMNLLNKPIPIFFCLLGVRGQIKIEITHLTLIGSISIQNYSYIS